MITENKLKLIAIISESIDPAIGSKLEARGSKLLHFKPGNARKNLLEQFKSDLLNPTSSCKDPEDALAPVLDPFRMTKEETPDLIIIEGKNSLQDACIIEASYAEFYFCDEINEAEINRAIEEFHNRKRNFGS